MQLVCMYACMHEDLHSYFPWVIGTHPRVGAEGRRSCCLTAALSSLNQCYTDLQALNSHRQARIKGQHSQNVHQSAGLAEEKAGGEDEDEDAGEGEEKGEGEDSSDD